MELHIFRFFMLFAMSLQVVSCGDSFPSRYIPVLPDVPSSWVSLLGEPHWRLEWLDSDGREKISDISPGGGAVIEIPVTWTNPVTAWPYWPDKNMIPGHFKPAGALFPFDVDGDRLRLTWEAGPDAVFYRELAVAAGNNSSKKPAYFDWPRFRSLFQLETTNADVRKDPWLVDWRSLAERTASSSFNQRRLTPEAPQSITIPVPAGPWYGASPFAEPLYFDFEEGETPVFPVRTGINVWVSAEGILRSTGETYVFTKFVRD
jgi:hypothetical protein